LAAASKDANQSRRLLSIAAALDGMSRADAAKIGGMDRQRLRDWVHRFNERVLSVWRHLPRARRQRGLALPFADTDAMQLHLEEISRTVATRSHAVLLLDRAGWHTTGNLRVPKNITLIFLPFRAPELKRVGQIWQYIRANWLSNRVFETCGDIIDAACYDWNKLIAEPNTIAAIGMRQWTHTGHS
jgi:hypothetical protein